jgi:hypothetical protein
MAKGDASDAMRQVLAEQGVAAVIPGTTHRTQEIG